MIKDYFNTLGVDENTSADEIKKAYKKLAMKHHPDRGGNQSEFQKIQEAYDVLTDQTKRAQWEQQKQFDGQRNFSFGFGFGPNIDDIIRQFHGGGPSVYQRQSARNRDIRLRVDLELESTLNKQTHHINARHANGTSKTIQADIPKGIQSGMQIRYPGHGDQSHPGIPPGDLFLLFNVQKHPIFHIDGIDISRSLSVNCLDAMLGGKVETTGLDGSNFEINIPPVTQHGTKFRIPGHGLWDVNQPIRGDLIIEIDLVVPSHPNNDQLSQFEKFKK